MKVINQEINLEFLAQNIMQNMFDKMINKTANFYIQDHDVLIQITSDIVNTAIVDILVGEIKPEISLNLETSDSVYQNVLHK